MNFSVKLKELKMNIPIVNNNIYVSNSRPAFGKGELYLPYGVSTANLNTRICLDRKDRSKILEIVEGLKEKMPDRSYLSMDEHGINLIFSSITKKERNLSNFTYGMFGPTIPFDLNQSKNNLTKFYEKFEIVCKQAIATANVKQHKFSFSSLVNLLKRK